MNNYSFSNTSNNSSQSQILQNDENLLAFGDNSIIKVRKFKESKRGQVTEFIYDILTYGRMKRNLECQIFGQVNYLSFTIYPSEGTDCTLLVLGEKNWKKGKIKSYGELKFSPILEDLPRYVESRKQSLGTRRCDEYQKLSEAIKNKGLNNMQETYDLSIYLEFIPEASEVLELPKLIEPESPLDDIRRQIEQQL